MALGAEPGDVLAASFYNSTLVSFHTLFTRSNYRRRTYALVSSSHNGDNASTVQTFDGQVDGIRVGPTERHVHNRFALRVSSLVNDPLHALDDVGVVALSVGVEDLDGDDLSALGDTVGGTGDGGSNVSAVAVQVSVLLAGDEAGSPGGAATKFRVAGSDTSVQDVDSDTLSGSGIKDVTLLASSGVRQAGKAGGSVDLAENGVGLDLGVELDKANLIGAGNLLDHVVIGIDGHSTAAIDLE